MSSQLVAMKIKCRIELNCKKSKLLIVEKVGFMKKMKVVMKNVLINHSKSCTSEFVRKVTCQFKSVDKKNV